MSTKKNKRTEKKQLGQFLTPEPLAKSIIKNAKFSKNSTILEPSFGRGSFIFAAIEKLLPLYGNMAIMDKLDNIFKYNLYGIELDKNLYREFFQEIKARYNYEPKFHNFVNCDFFLYDTDIKFDFIIGNPPFGGTINYKYQDSLDNKLGTRYGIKIKKETYSFFLVKSVEMLKNNGRLYFICSDSFLTINTMKGLRNLLMENGHTVVHDLKYFSEETNYGMVVINFLNGKKNEKVKINEKLIDYSDIKKTPNFSWKVNKEFSKYFSDTFVGKYLLCSSGMTVGKNELFIRDIKDGKIEENYKISIFDKKITLANEIKKARLNKISSAKKLEIMEKEKSGDTEKAIKTDKLVSPKIIDIPHNDYKFYNKANYKTFYCPPKYVVYWKNNGEAVYAYKNSGSWYLHGVGGKKFFEKEGLTWALIAKRIYVKYLPEGYILDSGAPVGILKNGVKKDELYFLIGWLSTDLCNLILKNIINHTQNIQGKDVERLPYPFWAENNKKDIIESVKSIIEKLKKDKGFDYTGEQKIINDLFKFDDTSKIR